MSPTPLLYVVGERESLGTPIDANGVTYEQARPPKDMVVLPVGHFKMYREPWLSKAVGAAINWFKRYL
jgi:fermentation-respiration switch protein FrsA (DUF1100 family)